MQPQVVTHPRPAVPAAGGVVLAVLASGPEHLRSALGRVARHPALLGALTRVVVLDTGLTGEATARLERTGIPVERLRVVRRPGATRPEALARVLVESVDEPRTSAVLLVDDVAVSDAQALLEAIGTARRSTASDVVGLRDPAAADAGPESWWGAVLPLDAVRALGATLPEAGDVALAELVLRAEAAGFLPSVLTAPGPVPLVVEADRLLLALLHRPVRARTGLLLLGSAEDAGLLLALRFRELVARRRALAAAFGTGGIAPRLRLWSAWPGLRRRARSGAVARASADGWALRLLDAEVNREWPLAEQEAAAGRPAGLRLPAWPTTKRGPSAA